MLRSPQGSGHADSGLPNVQRVVAIASRLERRQAALRRVLTVGAIAAGALLLLVIVVRVTPAIGLPPGHAAWPWIALGAAFIALAAGLMELLRPRDALADAIAVDERLSLRDRLSSAMALRTESAAFAQAAVRDGERVASDGSLPARVGRVFAVRWPSTWWVAPVLALAAFVSAWLLPQLDIWSRSGDPTQAEVQQARDDAAREIEGVIKAIEENPQLAEALAAEVEALAKDATPEDRKTPEEIRREALRKLTELSERLDEMLKDEQALTMEALKDQLSSLSLPNAPELQKFAEALKRGDFSKAREALEALQKDLQNGSLSEEQREALAKALEKMAEELAKSESERQALEEALQDAGLDPQLASNPDALKEAMENNPRLSESQREALRKAAQSQQKAGEMRKELAKQMSQMASECKGGQQGDGKQCGAGMGGMLSDMEMKQVMMMQAKAAASACKGGKDGLCQGSGQGQGGNRNGMTSGGGIGGGWRPEMPSATKTRIEQAKGNDPNADVIAREFIEGTPTVGASTAVLRKLEAHAASSAEEGNDDDPTPPHLVGLHKHYFGEFKRQVEAKRAAAEAAAPAGASGAAGGTTAPPATAPTPPPKAP